MRCCTRCELALGRTQVVIGDGAPRADIMFIGEAPGAQEDVAGRPFVGAGGRLFDTLLAANGIERSTVYVTNVVACRPPGNRTPRPREVLAHAPWLEEQIRLVRPSIIATLGRSALTYFIPGAKITELSGRPQQIMWQERALTVVPLFHPAAVLRSRELRPKLEAGLSELRRLRDAHAKPASRRSKRD
jgi:DNA polymerase